MASEDIKTLKFPFNIQKRPGAYIGSIEDASNIFREIIDNAIDECYRCKTMHNIDIKRVGDVYIISDDGRGIPIKKSTLDPNETMCYESLTNLNSGSKFEVNSEVSIGLNGLGTKATNALSEYYLVRSKIALHNINEIPERLKKIYKGEKYYYLKFVRGIKSDEGFDNYKSDFSTIVEFKPDAGIFESTDASIPEELPYAQYIIEHKYNKKLNIKINGTTYEDALRPYNTEFMLSDGKYTMLCGLEMLPKYDPGIIEGSVNGLICNKGWHVRNFCKALVKAMNILWNTDYSSDDILYGLRVRNIFLFGGNLNYTAQIKDTLASVEGYPSKGEQVADQLMPEVLKYLKKDKRYWEGHKKRIESLLDAKKKIDRENLVKETFFKKKVMPNKLVDCSSSNRRDTELFVVEGNSAGSSLVQARNAKIHAILPLRGKMLNTVGMPIEDVLKNQECENFIRAIGCGTKDHFVKNKFRYGKIVIAADSDSDGFHICNLVLGLIFDHCPELINMGVVYILCSPLFKVGDQYVYQETLKGVNTKGKVVKRFKGLGSLRKEDMAEIAFGKSRKLMQVTMTNNNSLYATQLMTSAPKKGELLIKEGVIEI